MLIVPDNLLVQKPEIPYPVWPNEEGKIKHAEDNKPLTPSSEHLDHPHYER